MNIPLLWDLVNLVIFVFINLGIVLHEKNDTGYMHYPVKFGKQGSTLYLMSLLCTYIKIALHLFDLDCIITCCYIVRTFEVPAYNLICNYTVDGTSTLNLQQQQIHIWQEFKTTCMCAISALYHMLMLMYNIVKQTYIQ